MAAEIATDVLIIEDETFIAMDLESLVKNLGHNVIGVARTHSDAVALAKNKKPGLILADIQLADGSSGLDAVNELLQVFEVPVVFITAYPERFLTGERPEPAFLISKPFQPAMVSAVASRSPSRTRFRPTHPRLCRRTRGTPTRKPRMSPPVSAPSKSGTGLAGRGGVRRIGAGEHRKCQRASATVRANGPI